jgi:hypothetical protein
VPVATITSTLIKAGPGRIYYAPLGTTLPTIAATANNYNAVVWTNWVEVGATDEGLTYSESTDTDDIRVAESLYAVRTVTTGKTASVAFSIAQVSDLNWVLASNGGTITVTGTAGTKTSKFVPPLAGSEVRKMLGFISADGDEIMIWPQVFNTAGFETPRAGFSAKHVLPVTFSVELPDPTVNAGLPYVRHVAGALAQSP